MPFGELVSVVVVVVVVVAEDAAVEPFILIALPVILALYKLLFIGDFFDNRSYLSFDEPAVDRIGVFSLLHFHVTFIASCESVGESSLAFIVDVRVVGRWTGVRHGSLFDLGTFNDVPKKKLQIIFLFDFNVRNI